MGIGRLILVLEIPRFDKRSVAFYKYQDLLFLSSWLQSEIISQQYVIRWR